MNDSGEYRCGSDLTGEAAVQVNVVASENEQELKSFYSGSELRGNVDKNSYLSSCMVIFMQNVFVILMSYCCWLRD